jgi:arylsulfatase A-like enzyme
MRFRVTAVALVVVIVAAHASVARAAADQTAPAAAPGQKLNVLFIAIDDLRPELGCYGHPIVNSPNIDRLAQQSLLFDRAYCQFSLCNPSRTSLLSGRRPETLKIYDLKTNLRDKFPDVVTLPQLFKDGGYRALSFGKIFHTTNGNHDDPDSWSQRPWKSPGKGWKPAPPTAQARDRKPVHDAESEDPHADDPPFDAPDCGDDDLIDGQIAKAAVAAMEANKDQPMFLAVGFHRPHMPWIAPKKYWDLYDPKQIALAPNPFLPKGAPAFASNNASELRRYMGVPKDGPIPDDLARQCIRGYYASVSYADAQVGRVLSALDRLGLRDRTVIVLWGDHGYQLGEHATWNKRTDWEIATRVPLLVSVPGQTTRGRKTEALVEFVDLYPTLAQLCGLTPPDKLEGTSFVPLLRDPSRPWKSAAFSIYHKRVKELGGPADGRALRTDRYRLIEWSSPKGEKKVYELYDEQSDPQENTNLADRPENKDLVQRLAAQLHQGWQKAKPADAK